MSNEIKEYIFDVEVTSEDILKGKIKSTVCCPIALAVKRNAEKSNVKDFLVSVVFRHVFIRFRDEKLNYKFSLSSELPENARKFILNFDNK